MMSDPKRLHPAAVIINLLKSLKEMIIPLGIFIFANRADGLFGTLLYGGAGLFLLILVVLSVLVWMKFTYRIEEDELRIEQGLFVKQRRYVPIERVQTINTTAGIVQQMFGLVRLEIETASGGKEAEIELTAISKGEAAAIKEALYERKQMLSAEKDELEETEPAPEKVYRMSQRELMIGAATSSGIGVILSAVFAFGSQVDEVLPIDRILGRFEFLTHSSVPVIALLIFIGFLAAWLLSMAGILLKYARFTLVKTGDDLVISRGLLEKNQLTIPVKRIQAVKVTENPLRQPLGYATVQLVCAGGKEDKDGLSAAIFPFVKKAKAESMLKEFLPQFAYSVEKIPVPKRAMRKYMIRYGWPALFPAALSVFFFHYWGLFALLLLPVFLLFGYLAYRDAGYHVNGEQLTLHMRAISRTSVILPKKRMQQFQVQQNLFQRSGELSTVRTAVMSSSLGAHYAVRDVEFAEGKQLYDWYSSLENQGEYPDERENEENDCPDRNVPAE